MSEMVEHKANRPEEKEEVDLSNAIRGKQIMERVATNAKRIEEFRFDCAKLALEKLLPRNIKEFPLVDMTEIPIQAVAIGDAMAEEMAKVLAKKIIGAVNENS